MAAPPCPRLAAELTNKILEAYFADDVQHSQYKGYIWFMQVLLKGGWISSAANIDATNFMRLVDEAGMRQILTPWLVPEPYSQDDITAMLVARELFTTSG